LLEIATLDDQKQRSSNDNALDGKDTNLELKNETLHHLHRLSLLIDLAQI